MTNTALLHPVGPLATRPAVHPHDLAAWLDEVCPVLAALSAGSARPSTGRERWVVEQRVVTREALDALDHALGEVDADDVARSDELEWLHTRVCAVSACLDRLSAAGSVAA